MKIFSLFSQPKLAAEWSYRAHGRVWRILFSGSGRIVGESRDQEQKRTSFFCLDERSGSVVWQDITVNEPWWVGIEGVHRDVVLLHEFANPSMPEHKGLRALDLEQGKELWHNSELTFWFAYRQNIYAYRTQFEKRVGYKLSLHSGQVEEEFGDALNELNTLRQLALSEEPTDDVQFPEILSLEALEPQIEAIVNKETKGADIQGEIEFIQRKPFLLMSYYTRSRSSGMESPVLESRFSVFNTDSSSKLYSDILAADAKAPVPDSFLIKGSLVYFIKNHHTLTALRLG